MQLTQYSDYSLRALMYLSLNGHRRCMIREIADGEVRMERGVDQRTNCTQTRSGPVSASVNCVTGYASSASTSNMPGPRTARATRLTARAETSAWSLASRPPPGSAWRRPSRTPPRSRRA